MQTRIYEGEAEANRPSTSGSQQNGRRTAVHTSEASRETSLVKLKSRINISEEKLKNSDFNSLLTTNVVTRGIGKKLGMGSRKKTVIAMDTKL